MVLTFKSLVTWLVGRNEALVHHTNANQELLIGTLLD